MTGDLDLEREMRNVLARLAAVSHGTTQSFNPIASKSGFGDRDGGDGRPPGGTTDPPHERWARAWNTATTDQQRLAALEGATDELDALTRRQLPTGFKQTEEREHERIARYLKDGEGIPLQEAAYRLRCAPTTLRRVRKNAGRDLHTGRPVETPAGQDRAARARELKQRHPGMSNRQIAQILDCDHKTVAADLRNQAA